MAIRLMVEPRMLSWWYWLATAILLVLGLVTTSLALQLAIGLSLIQIVHFRLRAPSFAAFPVQVRLAYAGLLLLASWPPLNWLFWIPAVGTWAQVLFGYCALARCLSLLPWNRWEPLSLALASRTFFSPPVRGNILQGFSR